MEHCVFLFLSLSLSLFPLKVFHSYLLSGLAVFARTRRQSSPAAFGWSGSSVNTGKRSHVMSICAGTVTMWWQLICSDLILEYIQRSCGIHLTHSNNTKSKIKLKYNYIGSNKIIKIKINSILLLYKCQEDMNVCLNMGHGSCINIYYYKYK